MKTYSSVPANERRKEVVCGVCGSSVRKPYWDCDTYTFSKCSSCGLIYQYPQVEQSDLSFRYDDDYFKYEIANEEVFFNLMLKTLKDINFSEITSGFKEKNPEILDVGCATGMFLEYMEGLEWKGRGVEICTPSAQYGVTQRGLDIFNGTLTDASYSDNQFSVVHSSHLIEHLTNPAEYVEEAYRILKPGGLFITTTPNSASLQRWLFGKNWRSAIADHMFLFSVTTLRTLIESKGFEVRGSKTWGGIAKGIVPDYLKKPVDSLAKKMGFGDVCVILGKKPG